MKGWRNNWRYWSLIALLVLGNAALFSIRYSRSPPDSRDGAVYPDAIGAHLTSVSSKPPINENIIPFVLGHWRGENREMAEGKCINSGAEVQICREYTDEKGNSVWLVFVYSKNRRAIHLPERLYQAYGYNIVATNLVKLRLSSAKLLIVEKGEERETVLYLLTDGEKVTHNVLVQQFSGIWNQLTGKGKGWALVRVFASSKDTDGDEVSANLSGFLELLIPKVLSTDFLNGLNGLVQCKTSVNPLNPLR